MFKKQPPPQVQETLRREGVELDDLRICTDTDIDSLGRYQSQWLAVSDDRLYVLQDGKAPSILLRLDIPTATEFRIQPVVGSGTLQARVDGTFVDIIRFTNRLADVFQKIARKLDRRLNGIPIRVSPEEEKDERRCPQCGLMLQFPGDPCPRCVSRGAVLARMWRILSKYRWGTVAIVAILLVGIGLDLVGPQLTKYLVDNVLPGNVEEAKQLRQSEQQWRSALVMLFNIVLILASVQVGRMIVSMVIGIFSSRIGTAITFDMRSRLLEHLEKLSVGYYDKQQVGSLVGRVAYDTEALHGFVLQLTGGFLSQLVMVIGVGVMMFTLNVKLALFTLVPAPLVICGSIVFWRYIYPRYYRFWDASSKQAGMLAGILSGIRVVKAFSQEEKELERFNHASDYLRMSRRRVDYSTAFFNPVMTLVFQLGGWIVWYVGGRNVLDGSMTLGSLMAFLAYLWMFYAPLSTLTTFTNWLTQFATQAHRIFEILDTPPEITDSKDPVYLEDIKGEIRFEGVSFGYDRHNPVLQDVDLRIAPGELVGIVGRSGSGKTTIVNLICRFYDVNDGQVLVDGHDVRQIARDQLRHIVGVVLQEPFLFRGSLWQNIAYGKPGCTPEEVITVSKAAFAHDFILRRPHGYDTWVGERGAGLSGGERQRIGIARVLLIDPRILILDEATSSVDAESEAAIQEALAELVQGRTTIAIAHRLSTLRNANRIIVVDRGRIVEGGTHGDLMEKGGIYSRLVKIQGQMTMPTVDRLNEQKSTDDEAEGKAKVRKDSYHPFWLTPDNARIYLGPFGALHIGKDGETYGGVYAIRCMPVYHPDRYISMRHIGNEDREVEIGLIRNLKEWPEEQQKLVSESLLKRYFIHTIQSIEDIRFFNGYLDFKVVTDLGPMNFMMRWHNDRAQDYGDGGKMLLDTEENRFLVPSIADLPDRDRTLFMRYIYW